MIVTEVDEQFPFHPPTVRADGCHLGQVIKDLEGIISPRKVKEDVDAMTEQQRAELMLLWETGFLWEDVLSQAYGRRLAYRPAEVCVDGIYCNADGLALDGEDWLIEEYKATFASSSKGIDSNWRWMTQVKGYCYAYSQSHDTTITRARFRVLWMVGDYSRPFKRQYKVYQVQFSWQEIGETWRMIVGHARRKGWVQ